MAKKEKEKVTTKDVNSARYLVSALIQATAIAWALIISVYAFYQGWFRSVLKGFRQEDYSRRVVKGEITNVLGPFQRSKEAKRVEGSVLTMFKQVTTELKLINVLSLVTIVLGAFTLLSIEETSFSDYFGLPFALLIVFFVLFIVTFAAIARTVNTLLYRGIS